MVHIDLQDIRYHFTSCGKVGRFGPSYEACMEYYATSKSRLSQPGILLQNIRTTAGGMFTNAQLFGVPHSSLYNITVAGASGGRGVCNIEQGHGISRTVQVELYSDQQLLILVGQRGLDYCDVEPSCIACRNQSQDLDSAMACNYRWYDYLSNDEQSIKTLGGGGGGGASMIRASTRKGLNSEPIVVGSGGGGTSALLQYDIVNIIGVNAGKIPSDVAYRHFINAKSSLSSNNMLVLGRRNSSSSGTAGLGGGYEVINNVNSMLGVDGGYLDSLTDFAVGGLDCTGNRLSGAFGGFGGGGGACAGGGGGGGYLGGSVLGEGSKIPGGGGLSVTGDSFGTSFKLIRFIGDKLNSEPDGYVDLIDADCDCIFKCVVYHEDDQFECTCPGITLVAPDLSDCYTSKLCVSAKCRVRR